jgi:aspartokinase
MIKITRPVNLNGAELLDELAAAGINVTGIPMLDGNNELWIDIKESDAVKAEAVAKKHNGNTVAPELTIQQKLAAANISIDELKAALGL